VACLNIYLCESDIDRQTNRLMEIHTNSTRMDSDSNWRSLVSSNFDAGVLFTHLLLCVKFGYRVLFIVPKHLVRLNGKRKWKQNRVWNSGKNKPLRQNSTVDYF